MLRQVARRGRLLASMIDSTGSYGPVGRILEDISVLAGVPHKPRMQQLPLDVYGLLLTRLRAQHGGRGRHYRDLPHPSGAEVVVPWVVPSTHVDSDKARRTFAVHGSHAGNSAVIFRASSGRILCGFIQDIWMHTFQDTSSHYLVVRPHEQLSTSDSKRNPFALRRKLHAHLLYSGDSEETLELITLADIIAHTAYIVRPPGTFKIQRGIMIAINLDRGRSKILY
jgi:hypothetical protein